MEDYINEETVIYGPGRISFAEALPGLLTSLGFLGTLIGLAVGLSGFNMADSAAVQNSIVTLIPGMRYAFMTSIFGVVGSVAFTLITRMVYGSTEHTLTQFYSAMSRHAGVLSVDPMTQIAIYQQEQTALIKTMAKDLNGKFTENVTQAIEKACEPMNATLKGFVNGITKEQARLIDAVLARFLDRLNESLSGSLRRFGQTLDETSRLQRENSDAVRASLSGAADVFNDITEMRRIIQELLEGTAQFVEQLNNERKLAEDAFMRVNSAVEQMEVVSRVRRAEHHPRRLPRLRQPVHPAGGLPGVQHLRGPGAHARRRQRDQRPPAGSDRRLTETLEQTQRAIDAAAGRMYRN